MQIYQVRYFLALARTLNFTRAAEQCNVTQPALTKAVQKLEQELGGALIHRERHLTQLTELGKMILPTLEKILAAAEAVRLQARGYQKKTIAPLKIGLVPSVSAALITELLLELARIIPDLRVDLREADADGLVAMLLDGEINAALVGDAVELPERIDHWLLFEERYVLVLSRKHPMASKTVIPLQDLHEAVFLERVGCDVAGRFKQACFADHPGPKVVHRSAQERHLQVLGPSWRQSTPPGCRRSLLFQLKATPSGARCSFWPWRGGSIRRHLTPLSRLLVFATGRVRWTSSAAHLPLPRTRTMFARQTHKVQAP
jgi:DNA-binding transcriptional LysR family regulator